MQHSLFVCVCVAMRSLQPFINQPSYHVLQTHVLLCVNKFVTNSITQKCYRMYVQSAYFRQVLFYMHEHETNRRYYSIVCVGLVQVAFCRNTKYGNKMAFQFQINEHCCIGVASTFNANVCTFRVKESMDIDFYQHICLHICYSYIQYVNLFSFQKAYFLYVVRNFVSNITYYSTSLPIYLSALVRRSKFSGSDTFSRKNQRICPDMFCLCLSKLR